MVLNSVQQVRQALSVGDWQTARKICEDSLQNDPGDRQTKRLLAEIEHRSGNPQKASRIYLDLVERNPDSADDWRGLALARKAMVDLPGTYAAITEFVKLNPNDSLALNTMGLCAYHMNQGDEALRCLDLAASIEPNVPAIHRNRGLVLVGLSRHAEADLAFNRALEIDPNDFPSLVQCASLHLRHDRPSDSLTLSRRALAIRPSDPEANFFHARALALLNNVDSAQKYFDLASKSDSRFLTPYAIWLIEEGHLDAARDVLRRRLSLEPNDGIAIYYSAEIASRDRKSISPEIIERLHQISLDPNHTADSQAFANYALGKYLERNKQFQESFAAYQKANDRFFGLKLRHVNDLVGTIDQEVANNKQIFTPQLVKELRSSGSNDSRPIFIVGMIRSGTTLVEQIVDAHSQVAGAGELRYWMENGPYALQNLINLPQFAQGYSELLDRLQPNSARVTDKMPLNLRFLGLISSAFPKAKVLWVRRDPMDTCFSVFATPFTDPPIFSYNLHNIGYVFRKYEELMAHWQSVLPVGSFHEVRYEDLVSDPETTTRSIFEYLELPFEQACLAPEHNLSAVRTPSSLQVRQPIYQTSVQRWQNFEPWLDDLKRGLGFGPKVT